MENYTFGPKHQIFTLGLSEKCVITALMEWHLQKIEDPDTAPFNEIHNCEYSAKGLIFYNEKYYTWFILQFS
jgi:hypothetical protein